MAEAARLLVGEIVGAQGIGGLLRVRSFTQEPADLLAYGPVIAEPDGKPIELRLERVAKGGVVIARAPGVTDRNAAERLRGVKLFLERGQLPVAGEDEFYHADLIGLTVELASGERLGVVSAVQDFGAGALLEVRHASGSTLLPFTRAVVPAVDLALRRIVVEPPPGLLPAERSGSGG
ncbi:MAG: 16S rRNA processing protein RimM [Proteobacteria bacterium]|nr:16S rRNA processing protein RimM [Pseudomonadota bacterium]MBI3496468.1 16S rRNA processing protein RimM [Pseudomonadota bacterium]